MRSRSHVRRGAALLFVLAALAAMSLLVVAFAAIARLESRAQLNMSDTERARFAAWSGVERAKFELRRGAVTPEFPLPWLRYDSPTGERLALSDPAGEPSFRMGFAPVPAALDGERTVPWPSGVVGATYFQDPVQPAFGGDYYVLRVLDANAALYLNDANPHLRRMLDSLGRALGLNAGLGARILAARPADGFSAVDDLRGVLASDELAALAPYLTTAAWVDRRVIAMGARLDEPDRGQATLAYLPPSLEPAPRAPVNINLAPRPVLVAVLHGIGVGGTPGAPSERVSFQQASELADAIVAFRNELDAARPGFQKWGQLYRFLHDVNETLSAPLPAALLSAILANANPNTDLNDLVPDLSMYRPVDKLDLRGATTELCFGLSGIFTVESLGVVLDPEARLAAQVLVRSTVRVFERYVERHQADFEAGRIDPPSPAPGRSNLRDLTSGPEYRNQPQSAEGLLAADYDGQMHFNVVTEQRVSVDGAFAGFLGESLDGEDRLHGGPLVAGGARGRSTSSVVGGTLAAPDFAGGSDLHPLGARLGPRALEYPADTLASVVHDVPEAEVIMTDGHGNNATTIAVIPAWNYQAVDAHAFELWFKPDFEQREEQVLLSWQSGGPRAPGTTPSFTAPSPAGLLAGVHALNVSNYLTAVALGGPGPQGSVVTHEMAGGFPLSPPPPSVYNAFFQPGGGPLPFGNFPYAGLGGGSIPPLDHPQVAADAETYASLLDAYYEAQLGDVIGDLIAAAEVSLQGALSWGAQASLVVWLEPAGADAISELYRLRARFAVERKHEAHASTDRQYARTWTGPALRPGTWHHLLFSFYALPPPQAEDVPPEHSNLFVDGQRVPAEGADAWPTEIHAQARIVEQIVAAVAAAGIEIEFDIEQYRVPVQIPTGSAPVRIGRDQSPPLRAGAGRYAGLVDNVIFQGNYPKFFDPPPGAGPPNRFDTWRPSLGSSTPPDADHHLSFAKRTPALEWDAPITIVGYAWTAWKHNDQAGGTLDLGLI